MQFIAVKKFYLSVWDYKKSDTNSIRRALKQVNWEFLFQNKSVHEQVLIFNKTLLNLFQIKLLLLKLVSAIFYQIFILSSNYRPSITIKNVFYFIEKVLFVLEIFKFLYFFPSFPQFTDSKVQMKVE